MNIKSEQLESVKCVIGQSTKKPNTVTMTVSEDFVIEVTQLFKLLKAGKKPKTGLCGLKLIAEYVEDIEDEEKKSELVEGMSYSLGELREDAYGTPDEGLFQPMEHKPHNLSIDPENGNVEGDEGLKESFDESDQDEFRDGEK